MKKNLLGICLLSALFLISCQTEETTSETQPQQSHFNVATDASELQTAINFNETGVIGIERINTTRNQESEWIFGIEQIASLEPPKLNGEELRATHVDVKGNYAYVSYNKEGSIYLGAIDIVDVSDKYNPVLVSRMKTDIADINSLYIDNNNNIVFTGASINGEGANHTLLGYVSTQNGQFSSDFNLDYGLAGHTGVHVLDFEGKTILISGNSGIVGSYNFPGNNSAFNAEAEIGLGDLRSAAFSNDKLAVLSGDEGLLDFSLNNEFIENTSLETAALTPESKRTIAWYGNNILVSEGTAGAGIYNFEAGDKTMSLPLRVHPDASSISAENKVTNAVSTDGNFIYMANGGAGLDIVKLNDQLTLVAEGIAEITGSANFVQAKGDYIYLAAGTGLKILRIIAPQSDVVTGDFLACSEFDPYTGHKNLTIPSSTEESYSGIMNLKHLNVNGSLNFCGDMLIEKSANLSSASTLNMSGNFRLGNKKSSENLVINSNSTFKVEGLVEIHGDLQINSGGTLEFVGDDSKIFVSGKVKINSGGEIIGDFEDLNNKFN
ncbi:hypothetical protein [Christiangramia forsetii]|uniref:Secreted protein n=2 Tax=Christiangramia forsetii TaxID=411153 RepID=A0M6X2_CHRFK|nr:hypothetical protein [Christiangramia forsetii]GGG29287.1 hypothetical protein GCM10011532_10960 [Christiangramia forsetii]CAL68367.1 conserved hypothetical protein, secreted [Christiangramia forsetii KT0803]